MIQINNPRGFSEAQERQFLSLVASISNNPCVKLIHGPVSHEDFHQVLRSLDLLVLPYNPINYCRRASGLAMHAAIYEKPVLASSGTWTSDAVGLGHLAGMVFQYEKNDEERTVGNINSSITSFIGTPGLFKKEAARVASHFVETNRPEVYVQRLLDYYGCPDAL